MGTHRTELRGCGELRAWYMCARLWPGVCTMVKHRRMPTQVHVTWVSEYRIPEHGVYAIVDRRFKEADGVRWKWPHVFSFGHTPLKERAAHFYKGVLCRSGILSCGRRECAFVTSSSPWLQRLSFDARRPEEGSISCHRRRRDRALRVRSLCEAGSVWETIHTAIGPVAAPKE